MRDIIALLDKRGRVKSKITRLENFVNTYENDENTDINDFVIREDVLVKTYDEYEILQNQLEDEDATHEADRLIVELHYIAK